MSQRAGLMLPGEKEGIKKGQSVNSLALSIDLDMVSFSISIQSALVPRCSNLRYILLQIGCGEARFFVQPLF